MIVNSSSNIQIIKGNIFTSTAQTLVNTVNCVGVMGAGIALEFKLRFPEMFERYADLCQRELIKIGTLWIFKTEDNKLVLNFPTKLHWKYPSKVEYLEKGLIKFVETYEEKGITSIAFPLLGTSRGGIDENLALKTMNKYLSQVSIPVEIYRYDPTAYDDLFVEFKIKLLKLDNEILKKYTGLRINYIEKLKNALLDNSIKNLSSLATVNGIGIRTLEKSFQFAMNKNFDGDLTLGI